MLFFVICGCCVITLWGLRNCSTSSVVTLGSQLVSCKQPTLSPNKIPRGVRPICDARQYFIHMCILHPSLYSCAHTNASSSPLKAWALQHEVDVQSHLSSCVLQLEELKVVFQIPKLFRCQIFIAVQHMASWLSFFSFSSFRLQSQTTGSCSCFKFFSMLLHILVPSVRLCTHFMYFLLYMAGVCVDRSTIPVLSVLWPTELPKKQGLLSFPEVSRNTFIKTRCCRKPLHAATIFTMTGTIKGSIRD